MSDDAGRPTAQAPTIAQSLWRYRYLVLLLPLLVALLAYAVSDARPRTYEAEARVFLVDPREGGVLGGGGQPRVDTDAFVNQQVQRALSRPVLERVAAGVPADLLGGRELTVGRVEAMVEVVGEPDLLAIRVAASAASGELAAALANGVTDAFDQVVRERGIARAERGVVQLSGELDDIGTQITDLAAQLAAAPEDPLLEARLQSLVQVQLQLEARQRELTVEAVAVGSGIDLVEPAVAPVVPSAPRPLRSAVLGGLLTLLLVAAGARWRAVAVRTITHRLDAERILGVPLLGEVPRADLQGLEEGQADHAVAEALQFIRSSVDFAIGHDGPAVLSVTSATAGEGKTTVALLLALAMGEQHRVVVVDADLRARGLTRRLGLDGRHGLTDLIERRVPLQECVTGWQGAPGEVALVPAGSRPAVSAGLLRSEGFTRRLSELSDASDIVIMDAPPLLAVADALVISARADAVVLVVEHGLRTADLERLGERLAILPQPVLGYIYNRAPLRDTGYGYGYGYGEEAAPRSRPTTWGGIKRSVSAMRGAVSGRWTIADSSSSR